MKNKTYRFTPLLVAIGVVVGIFIGGFYANYFSGSRLNIINSSTDKFNSLLHIIDDQYVDDVNIPNLVESALPAIMQKLDPHSVYIPASEAEASMQDLKGSFSGIGIQFIIHKDTLRIVKVLAGGPSESVGLQPGDRIVSIDGKKYVGPEISADSARAMLKGKSGTNVRVGIKRVGHKGIQDFTIARGDIPLQSIDAVYMADETTGYVRITTFGETTYDEFLAALATLNRQGFRNLIIDLRGNLGGYMEPAVQIANEFLPKDRLIVYTEGRKSPREDFKSNGRGTYQQMPLVILVDETTASASEILSGAIQDNDRGTIIGRRTFGKGLVQVPIQFDDGSMLRLTKARYYTPAGRCVQKPYTPGDEEDYEQDLILRAEHGEYYNQDSIKTSGEKFHTSIGRTVYGGGGITPDVFISRDTLGLNSYFREAYLGGYITQYAYSFVDENRRALSRFKNVDEVEKFLKRKHIVENFATYAQKQGLKRRNLMIRQSRDLLTDYIGTNIIDDVLGIAAAAEYANRRDPAVIKALDVFARGAAFPKLSESDRKNLKTAKATKSSTSAKPLFALPTVFSQTIPSPFSPLPTVFSQTFPSPFSPLHVVWPFNRTFAIWTHKSNNCDRA